MSNLIARIVLSVAVQSGDEEEIYKTWKALVFGAATTPVNGELMMEAAVRAI